MSVVVGNTVNKWRADEGEQWAETSTEARTRVTRRAVARASAPHEAELRASAREVRSDITLEVLNF